MRLLDPVVLHPKQPKSFQDFYRNLGFRKNKRKVHGPVKVLCTKKRQDLDCSSAVPDRWLFNSYATFVMGMDAEQVTNKSTILVSNNPQWPGETSLHYF